MQTGIEILAALRDHTIPLTSDQIREGWALLKTRHNRIQNDAIHEFGYGDRVSFEHRGTTLVGRVTKINVKSVAVDVAGLSWRVGPGLLRITP